MKTINNSGTVKSYILLWILLHCTRILAQVGSVPGLQVWSYVC